MSVRQKFAFGGLSLGVLALTVWLGMYWINPQRLTGGIPVALAVGMLLTMSFVMFHRPFLEVFSWVVLRKVTPVTPPAPPDGLRVALITTFVPGAEPIEMLKATLKAMVEADYPHDTWVLDEGNDPEVQLLCDYFGVFHFTRKGVVAYNTEGGRFAAKTKGGNHNAWYDAYGHTYDIVSQFDTDFVVKPDVLTSVLGFFDDPEVAFVGTPQVYGNTKQSWIARGAAEQTYAFYGPIMRGLGARRQGLLIGANHTVRVAALQDVGWYFAHLAEDLATGMTFHSRGWKSVYNPQVLAIGEGPATWQAYFTQQYRWAFSCLDLLFRHSFRLVRTMPLRQALRYLWMQTFYLNGVAMLLGMVLLGVYFITGVAPANMDLLGLMGTYLPLIFWRQAIMVWSQRFNARPDVERGMLWAGRFITIAALPIYLMAFIGVVRGKRMTFKVTPKGEDGSADESLALFKPHLIISAVLLLGMVVAVLRGHTSPIYLGWGVLTASLMTGFAFSSTMQRAWARIRASVPKSQPTRPPAHVAPRRLKVDSMAN